MSLTHRFTDGALLVHHDGHEVLRLEHDGRIVTRALTRDGRLLIQEQFHLRLLRWLVRPKSPRERIIVCIHQIPAKDAGDFTIPSVFAFFVSDEWSHPLVLTREALSPRKLRLLLRLIPPVTAVLNAGEIHIPRSSRIRARGLGP